MDREHLKKARFDIEMAKLDVSVAPPGIDRVELARSIFGDFLEAGCGVGPMPERLPVDDDDGTTAPDAD